jgi:hypothetical protein
MGRVLAARHKRTMPEFKFLSLNDTALILPTAEFQECRLMNCSQSSGARIMPVFVFRTLGTEAGLVGQRGRAWASQEVGRHQGRFITAGSAEASASHQVPHRQPAQPIRPHHP